MTKRRLGHHAGEWAEPANCADAKLFISLQVTVQQ